MLRIQRASAGSGKTYALAKKYILNLIAFKNQNNKWVLRNEKQIEDAISHILAITFTNKATNEMKQRIVENLSLLATAADSVNLSPDFISSTPYLLEFHNETGAGFQEIGIASEAALKTVLNNYSKFKISTIDSFFQEILRTFTYEANINESYQLEIDSDFINDSALNEAINELDSRPSKMGNATFWLKTLIQEEAKKSQHWNLFNKSAASSSIYKELKNSLRLLEKEDFKNIKESLDNYFSIPGNIDNLLQLYKNLREKAITERENLLKQIQYHRAKAEDYISANKIPDSQLNSNFLKQLIKIRNIRKISDKVEIKFNFFFKDKSVFKKNYQVVGHPLDQEVTQMYNLLKQWIEIPADSYYKSWLIYGPLLPLLGLILEVRRFLFQVLDSNNLIQLSETGYILKKIIGNDDAPFIYERLGNRINNYLIDEFQDTSGLQWDIIYPLLLESDSKGDDSLIIGDPKQSIYRFRNADHTLITEVVPAAFPDHEEAGFSKEDNTNWRSNTLIVKFNNYLFKNIAAIANNESLQNGLPSDFQELYSNVVQYPNNQKGKGFVEIRFFEKPLSVTESDSSEEYEEEDEDNLYNNWFEARSMSELGPLLSSLIQRGYAQKDIGILVPKTRQGKTIVETLINYNTSLPENQKKIDFISEESLSVSSSPAVKLIVSIIERITKPASFIAPKIPEKNESENDISLRHGKLNWNRIRNDYILYSGQHPELSTLEKINSFLNQSSFEGSLSQLLESLPTPSLTSIVESIIKTFLDKKTKENEALYLASFQDLVNEYSVGHHNDPASFLEWWHSKGSMTSVSSPAGIDAVQIMTVHKSKGLEFKCVILPFATDSFTPIYQKTEWRWVEPVKLKDLEMPPYLPVLTNKDLLGSKHENIYMTYYDQILTDKLNMYYVALTRARNELYIFTKKPIKNQQNFFNYLKNILMDNNGGLVEFSEEEQASVISQNDIVISEDKSIISIGEPFSSEEIRLENLKDLRQNAFKTRFFSDYYINDKRPRLKSVASTLLPSEE